VGLIGTSRQSWAIVLTLVIALSVVPASGVAATPALQSQCFAETGYCIDEPAFAQYFSSRGGARILGFPVSRTFQLEGFRVQFFQRVVLQLQASAVARLNVLDPGVLPVVHANQSVFPAPDPGLAADAPRPDDPGYAQRVAEYLRSVSPDIWNGQRVGFSALFNSTVPAGNDVSPEIRTLLNLEIWGLPTSQPDFDPGNRGFVYQRFQRGIMHFRADCACTEGILVGDYLKAVLTGNGLPDDLAADMRGSRYFGQYAPGAAGWIARPGELPATDLSAAFEPGSGSQVATPIPITTASLSGSLQGGSGARQVAFIDLPFQVAASSNGSYAFSDIPPGQHQLYAVDEKNQASDTYLLTFNAGDRKRQDIVLEEFKVGTPLMIVGDVVGQNNQPVSGALVWRLGSGAVTHTDSAGVFRLVDAFTDVQKQRSTDNVTLLATAGGRWGLLRVHFDPNNASDKPITSSSGNTSDPMQLKLAFQGSPAARAPAATDLLKVTPSSINQAFQFKLPNADVVTAHFRTNEKATLTLTDKNGQPLPNVSSNVANASCRGTCDSSAGAGMVVKIPTGQPEVWLQVVPFPGTNPAAHPSWDEFQVLDKPPPR
jgi:hypothetical protein